MADRGFLAEIDIGNRWIGSTPTWVAHRDGSWTLAEPADMLSAAEVRRQIEAHPQARVLFLTLGMCGGGLVGESLEIVAALRRFSAEVGPVVAHVAGIIGSTGPLIAMAADLVIMDPVSKMLLHAAHLGRERSVEATRDLVPCFAARCTATVEEVELWLSRGLPGSDAPVTIADAEAAISNGLADAVGTLDQAHDLAVELALGRPLPLTARGEILRRRTAPCPMDAGEAATGDLLAGSIATSDYTYSGTQGTSSETATQGARLRNNSAPGSLPAIICSPPGLKVGSYIVSEAVVAGLTALARSGTSTTDVVWYRGNNAPSGIPVLVDPVWTRSTAYALGDRVSGYPVTAGTYPLNLNRDGSAGAATEIYICTQAGTSASTGAGPTGGGSGIVDGTVLWQAVCPIANAERVAVYTWRVQPWSGAAAYAYSFDIRIQPQLATDNLDGLLYAEATIFTAAKATPALAETTYVALPFGRGYYAPTSHTDSNNAIKARFLVNDTTLIDYNGGGYPFNGYLRLKLWGVNGYSSRDFDFTARTTVGPGNAGIWTLGGSGGGGSGGGGGGGLCPAPEVGVFLPDGTYRPAGLLQTGDRIWTIPGGPSNAKEPGVYEVTAVEVGRDSERLALSLDDGTRLVYSPRHLVMTPSGWAAVKTLRDGDPVLTIHGMRRVSSVLPAASGPVVRITTSASTYVTEGGILNHNLKVQ